MALSIEEAHARARAAWPGVDVPLDEFAAHVRARAGEGPIEALRTDELYLVCGCLAGRREALDAFERAYGPTIAGCLSRFDLSEAERKDVAQALRVSFFVTGKLAGYAGTGALHGWIKSAATRAAIDLVDARKPRARHEEDILEMLPATGDLELDGLRARFAEEFRVAFSATVAALDPRDRALLAQHYLDGLTIDQLAVVLGTHRATAARRLAKLRDDLFEGTRARLQAVLAIDERAFESLMQLARSRLDVSVFRLLRP